MSAVTTKPYVARTIYAEKSVYATFSGKVSDIDFETKGSATYKKGIDIPIELRSTILDVKKVIEGISGIPVDHLVLLAGTKELADGNSIRRELQENSSLSFRIKKCEKKSHCPDMLKIKNVCGPTLKVPFSEGMTVGQVRKTLEDSGVILKDYKLYGRNELTDDTKIKDIAERLALIPRSIPTIHPEKKTSGD